MTILNTTHRKKSALITALILIVLMWTISNIGMKYFDPPLEYGIRISYGTTPFDSDNKPKIASEDRVSTNEVKDQTPDPAKNEVLKEPIKNQVITQNRKEAPAFFKGENTENKKLTEKAPPILKSNTPSESALKAFENLLKRTRSDEKQTSQSDRNEEGLKGDKSGLNAKNYYKNMGNDVESNYNLAGRNALSKPVERPKCQEEGLVVVSIEVDKKGQVTKAVAGVKGTTNSTSCLLEPARSAALRTTWNADPNAPSKQKGTIIYKFSLSK